MTTIFSVLALFLFTATGAHARYAETSCGELTREAESEDVECLAKELIAKSFPELKSAWEDGRIRFEKFNSEDTFLRSAITAGFTRAASGRQYAIQVNPAMTRTFLPVLPRPSLQAVQAMLAHELVHLSDYEQSTAVGLAKYLKYSLTGDVAYERATDERAFELGYAYGIGLFRAWLATRLGEEAYARKMEGYYTVEEIHEWIQDRELSRPAH